MKTLYLVKMGCDFFEDDRICSLSDCGNYRIETRRDMVRGKDGRDYFLSFSTYTQRRTRHENKRTGKPLKNPVVEIVRENALAIDTQFEDERGAWRNAKIEKDIYDMGLTFNKADILKAVNYISADVYDNIEIL